MSKRGEIRRKWEQIVGRYERAGVSQAAFAVSQKVGQAALRYWIYKLRRECQDRKPSAPEVRLLPVQIAGGIPASIEVRLGELSIALPVGIPVTYLAELVSVLRDSRC